jgi:hypothetical protein
MLESLEDRNAPAVQTFTVISFADNGAVGTLRWAIDQANSNNNPADIDIIQFNVQGPGTISIANQTPLPTITQPVHIDGWVGSRTIIDGDQTFGCFASAGTGVCLSES